MSLARWGLHMLQLSFMEVFCTLFVLLVCEVTCGRMKGLQAAGCLVAGRWFVQVAKAGFISLLPKPFSTYLC